MHTGSRTNHQQCPVTFCVPVPSFTESFTSPSVLVIFSLWMRSSNFCLRSSFLWPAWQNEHQLLHIFIVFQLLSELSHKTDLCSFILTQTSAETKDVVHIFQTKIHARCERAWGGHSYAVTSSKPKLLNGMIADDITDPEQPDQQWTSVRRFCLMISLVLCGFTSENKANVMIWTSCVIFVLCFLFPVVFLCAQVLCRCWAWLPLLTGAPPSHTCSSSDHQHRLKSSGLPSTRCWCLWRCNWCCCLWRLLLCYCCVVVLDTHMGCWPQ